jgi:hypothetical protein
VSIHAGWTPYRLLTAPAIWKGYQNGCGLFETILVTSMSAHDAGAARLA